MKKPHGLWLVAILILLLTSCIPPSAPSTVKVGLVAPFSGRDAALGYNMLVAARLGIKEWNERGGVGGYYLELVAQDDRNDPEMGALQARKMALDPQMLGVIGHPSAESALAAGPVYRQAGLPAVLVGPALREEDLGGPPIFLLGPTAQGMAREVIRLAEAMGAHRLAVLAFDPGPPGPGRDLPPSARLALSVEHLARSAGLELAFGGVVSHVSGQGKGLSEQLKDAEKTKDTRPDLVFYSGGYAEGGSLLAELRQQGVRAPFLGGPGLANPDLLKIAGPAASGAYYLSAFPYPSQIPEASSFLSGYRAAAGTDPWPQALLVYDGLNAMLQALDQASKVGQKPSREALRQGLVQGPSHGLSGLVAFDAQGHQVGGRVQVYQIEGLTWPGRPVQ